jgi:DNA-binding NarL/FixJ family response regulator
MKFASPRILVVDDSEIVRGLIKTLLAEQNPAWEIAEAGNGQEAVEKALLLQPDLVLLDLNLPDISGLDAVIKIRQHSPATKIIICSLNDSAHIAAMAQHVGADGHFTKTSSPEDLHKTIASVLSR